MSVISEVIIWVAPIIGGLAIWLMHEAYVSIKEDIKDIKDRQIKTRDELADVKSDVRMASSRIGDVDKSVEIVTNSIRNLDNKSGDTKELSLYFRTMENKLNEYNANYGKVILILQKMLAKNLPPKDQ
jgi:hypothetical protein